MEVTDFRCREDHLIPPLGLAFTTIDIIRQEQNSLIQTSGQLLAKLNHVQASQTSDFLTRLGEVDRKKFLLICPLQSTWKLYNDEHLFHRGVWAWEIRTLN